MDSLDEKLVRVLGADARQNVDVIAKQFKVSPSTIRRRIAGLIRSGILRIIGVVDPDKVGYPLCAVVALNTSRKHLNSIVDMLASRPEVKWLAVTSGQYDIIAIVFFPSFEELSGFVRGELDTLGGISESKTFICMEVKKGRFVPLLFDAEVEPR